MFGCKERNAWVRMRGRNKFRLTETELAAVGSQRELKRIEIPRRTHSSFLIDDLDALAPVVEELAGQ
jgi:hypothetical protein